MRLIDADAFADEMRERQDAAKAWEKDAKDAETAARADAVLSFLCEVKLALDKMPTVDAVPVRHGEWLQEHGIYCCSECGAAAPYDVQGDIIEYWPDLRFCYRCGAKMDKEDNNGFAPRPD